MVHVVRNVAFGAGVLATALCAAPTAAAQSLILDRGERGVEAVVGGSFGPSSHGVESRFGASLDGRVDLGVAINRYTYTFDTGDSSFREVAPYVRFFAVKERTGGSPISVSVGAQLFLDDFDGDDSGGYVMVGPTLHKNFSLTDTVSVQGHLGFSFVRESYTFDDVTDSQFYLARLLGFTVTTRLGAGRRSWLQFAVEEQSFRQETYRAARVGFVRLF